MELNSYYLNQQLMLDDTDVEIEVESVMSLPSVPQTYLMKKP